ncbi:MAG: thiamine phosphate synthase [Chloroflexi bacterium]|nr:thiamine phosphate synthase [Chloroflexota bacterium]
MNGGRPVLPLPIVMFVTGCEGFRDRRLEDVVQAVVEGGVNAIQVREKSMPAGELYAVVQRLRAIVGNQALLLVNDRVDVALAAGADGVQLGESGLPCEAARRLAPDLVLGRSVHDVARAAEAIQSGADLLVVGTMFASTSHPGSLTAGPPLIRKIAAKTTLPLIGIGGITAGNAAQVIGAGASGVAVISTIAGAPDPREAAARLVAAVTEAWPTAPLHKRH